MIADKISLKCKDLPSTIPHGYILPLIFLPPASTTVLLPTTANGMAAYRK